MDTLIRRFRGGGKNAAQSLRSGSISSPSLFSHEKGNSSRLLELPSELRNAIYEHLADDTVLSLALAKRRRPKQTSAITALLLAGKQINREYQPILLANAVINFHISKFDFDALMAKLDSLPEEIVNALASNRRLWISLSMSHTLRPAEMGGLSRWLAYKQDVSTPSSSPTQVLPYTLRFRYEAVVDPPRSLASAQNTKVALVTALLRQLARLGGRSDRSGERQRMMYDLARYKDSLMGVHRTNAEHEIEIGGLAAEQPRSFSGVQWTPQYR